MTYSSGVVVWLSKKKKSQSSSFAAWIPSTDQLIIVDNRDSEHFYLFNYRLSTHTRKFTNLILSVDRTTTNSTIIVVMLGLDLSRTLYRFWKVQQDKKFNFRNSHILIEIILCMP